MIFPGFPGVLSFFQVFQVEWEPYDHWGPVPTCSVGDLLERHPGVATESEAHMVSKRVEHILLECFLVHTFRHIISDTLIYLKAILH